MEQNETINWPWVPTIIGAAGGAILMAIFLNILIDRERDDRVAQYMRENSRLEREIDALEGNNDVQRREIKNLRQEIDCQKGKNSALTREFAKLNRTLRDLQEPEITWTTDSTVREGHTVYRGPGTYPE